MNVNENEAEILADPETPDNPDTVTEGEGETESDPETVTENENEDESWENPQLVANRKQNP